jgi:hypothetical protein
MLIKMIPEQVSALWETFAPMFAQSLPPEIAVSRDILTNNLAAVLRGDLTVWIEVDEEEQQMPRALITTYVWEDPISCIRSLMVYHLYVMQNGNHKEWMKNIETLKRYGETVGCSRLIGFAGEDPKYLRFLRTVGGDTDTRLVIF